MSRQKGSRLNDENTCDAAAEILSGESHKYGPWRFVPFLGPYHLTYVDLGNIATNIQGGAQYG